MWFLSHFLFRQCSFSWLAKPSRYQPERFSSLERVATVSEGTELETSACTYYLIGCLVRQTGDGGPDESGVFHVHDFEVDTLLIHQILFEVIFDLLA